MNVISHRLVSPTVSHYWCRREGVVSAWPAPDFRGQGIPVYPSAVVPVVSWGPVLVMPGAGMKVLANVVVVGRAYVAVVGSIFRRSFCVLSMAAGQFVGLCATIVRDWPWAIRYAYWFHTSGASCGRVRPKSEGGLYHKGPSVPRNQPQLAKCPALRTCAKRTIIPVQPM